MDSVQQEELELRQANGCGPTVFDEGSRLFPLDLPEELDGLDETHPESTIFEETDFEPRWWPGNGFTVD